MVIDLVLQRLNVKDVSETRAMELAHLGFMEWMDALPAGADFRRAAIAAHECAAEYPPDHAAISAFRDLLMEAVRVMPRPLALRLPAAERRGGHNVRRLSG